MYFSPLALFSRLATFRGWGRNCPLGLASPCDTFEAKRSATASNTRPGVLIFTHRLGEHVGIDSTLAQLLQHVFHDRIDERVSPRCMCSLFALGASGLAAGSRRTFTCFLVMPHSALQAKDEQMSCTDRFRQRWRDVLVKSIARDRIMRRAWQRRVRKGRCGSCQQ